MSFKESIILPVELFEKCHFQTEDDDSDIALLDKQIPLDLKMKLYSHSKCSKIKTPPPDDVKYEDTDFIVQLLPEKVNH